MLIKKHHDLWHRSPYRLTKKRKSKEESVKMFTETHDRKAYAPSMDFQVMDDIRQQKVDDNLQ